MEQIAMLNGLDSRRRRRRRKSSAMGFLGEDPKPDMTGGSNTGYMITFAIFVAIAYVLRPGQDK